ncbi:hypothetical protein THOG11_20040 [Vibrio harveyi]|nr:hypothetical protein TH15OA1_530355 [Vibrio harveyi]CAH1554488.1 hypothetical protein THOD03_20040 [Vibrio harveyi]CAH1561218.1 hypothetical protein THOG11_20040 [Vibrio harveyi]
MGDCSKAVQATIYWMRREPLSPFIYKYPKVAKPKLRFEEARLIHEHSSWLFSLSFLLALSFHAQEFSS